MKVTIWIDCETISELWGHLTELRKQVKKESKRLKLDPTFDELPKDVNLNDNNCYGWHQVNIKEDGEEW